jgi:tyrosyl-tRNA synthetase
MDLESRIRLVSRPPTEEIVQSHELERLFQTVSKPRHYIGLEISGKLHLGSLIVTGYKINDFLKANIDCNVFLADWHTYINNKLHGNWEKIAEVSNYYSEAFKFFCPGVNVVLGSSMYNSSHDYWQNLIRYSKLMTLPRTLRTLTIMGRSEKESLDLSQLLYPSMQSVDIQSLDLDIVHAGMDQRKIHMLVREIFPRLGWKVPVSVHHHLLPGLEKPLGLDQIHSDEEFRVLSKMSKSKPKSSISIHDDERLINEKIAQAYCPPGVLLHNPVLEIARYVVFHEFGEFQVERPAKYGGDVSYEDYVDLAFDYEGLRIHPVDLKNAVARYLNKIVEPLRRHFSTWDIINTI